MPEENLELVRRIYATWETGEVGESFLAEDVEWINPADALEPGTRTGVEGFCAAMGSVFGVWEELRVEPDRLEEVGGRVLMIGQIRGRARRAGEIEVTQPHAHLWTFRGGKVWRFRWFSSGKQALQALGSDP